MDSTTRLFAYGSALVILMLLAVASTGFYSTLHNNREVKQRLSEQLAKIDLVNELSTIIQNRTRFTQSILLLENDTTGDKSRQDLAQLNGAYDATRQRLFPMLAPGEQKIMASIDGLNADVTRLNHQVASLLELGSRDEASKNCTTGGAPQNHTVTCPSGRAYPGATAGCTKIHSYGQ